MTSPLAPWKRWRQRRKATRRTGSPNLREFVYLDEISVYSLLASRQGPITEHLTESASLSEADEVGGEIGASAGVAKSSVRSRMGTTRTTGSQIVRKSIVQASFKELYDLEANRLALCEPDPAEKPPNATGIDDIARLAQEARGWCYAIGALRRGELFEVQVELEAAPIFRVSATISSLLEVFREQPLLVPEGERASVAQGAAIARVLDTLMAGLVPIRARAVDWVIVGNDLTEFIVHRRLVQAHTLSAQLLVRPLYVVGVTEVQQYWKDLRRVLFSRARYGVLCRLGQDGVTRTFSPVKLVDVLRDILPDVARGLDLASMGLMHTLVGSAPTATSQQGVFDGLVAALLAYGRLLPSRDGQPLDEARLADAAVEASAGLDGEDVEAARRAFGAFERLLGDYVDIPAEPEDRMALRMRAREEAGLGFRRAMTASSVDLHENGAAPTADERYLDGEIIAIYW